MMDRGLRIGLASQTPLVRALRPFAAMERDRGSLPNPLPLRHLVRGIDYSFTAGGVARMIHSMERTIHIDGEWVALSNGIPRVLEVGRLALHNQGLPDGRRLEYGRCKEVVWEILNGLPPRFASPEDVGPSWGSFLEWSTLNGAALTRAHAERPFDIFYVHDWQHLPEAPFLPAAPKVFHYHVPFADWVPKAWAAWIVRSMDEYDAVIVSTRRYADALRAAGCHVPLHVVRPWIDHDEIRTPADRALAAFGEKFDITPDDEVVLHVGRMDPVKGQDRLIRAFAHVARKRPAARLVLVGNGSYSSAKQGIGLSKGPKWRASLEAMVAELGVGPRVVFTGHLPQHELRAAYARGDVFAFPSVAEGFGLAVAEAWRLRTPAVVSSGAGISELMTDGEDGFVVDAENPEALSQRIVALLADPGLREYMAERGHDLAREHCSPEKGSKAIRDLLDQVHDSWTGPKPGAIVPATPLSEAEVQV
ncbi:MAG: glycosyltransferase family 4 protein [Thermoplasmatota archaeon]